MFRYNFHMLSKKIGLEHLKAQVYCIRLQKKKRLQILCP